MALPPGGVGSSSLPTHTSDGSMAGQPSTPAGTASAADRLTCAASPLLRTVTGRRPLNVPSAWRVSVTLPASTWRAAVVSGAYGRGRRTEPVVERNTAGKSAVTPATSTL